MTGRPEDALSATIRPATQGDRSAIAAVVTAAFGQPDEAGLVAALVADGDAQLEFVAVAGDAVLGHISCSAT